MQTIIRDTIGPTRLSLVIGNESPSGRRQSAKSLVFHFPPLPALSLPRRTALLFYTDDTFEDFSNFYRDPHEG